MLSSLFLYRNDLNRFFFQSNNKNYEKLAGLATGQVILGCFLTMEIFSKGAMYDMEDVRESIQRIDPFHILSYNLIEYQERKNKDVKFKCQRAPKVSSVTCGSQRFKANQWHYSSTKANYNFNNHFSPPVFFRDNWKRRLSLNEAHKKQSMFYNDIRN